MNSGLTSMASQISAKHLRNISNGSTLSTKCNEKGNVADLMNS